MSIRRVAGIRTDTGEEVFVLPSLWWGDRQAAPGAKWEILGDRQRGTYAELVRVPLECVAPKPAGLSFEQAAALPLVGLTTYRALFRQGGLVAGESLLVLGAGGGVATMAVMLASAMGIRARSLPHPGARLRRPRAWAPRTVYVYGFGLGLTLRVG